MIFLAAISSSNLVASFHWPKLQAPWIKELYVTTLGKIPLSNISEKRFKA
uniref:Uncharacterized protein n=1 Tax=Rhizophora mucronata TaxID=61149 RepID=A0A2P2KCU1_RHIMU